VIPSDGLPGVLAGEVGAGHRPEARRIDNLERLGDSKKSEPGLKGRRGLARCTERSARAPALKPAAGRLVRPVRRQARSRPARQQVQAVAERRPQPLGAARSSGIPHRRDAGEHHGPARVPDGPRLDPAHRLVHSAGGRTLGEGGDHSRLSLHDSRYRTMGAAGKPARQRSAAAFPTPVAKPIASCWKRWRIAASDGFRARSSIWR
jgi:hypothetical protein